MWGKADTFMLTRLSVRITPTHVGKSLAAVNDVMPDEDHPHPCGEKRDNRHMDLSRLGSPPPMWGKDSLLVPISLTFGITPTHVGKSADELGLEIKAKDHPHPCGEKLPSASRRVFSAGSPPPMWGKGLSSLCVPRFHRITPTHVGKRWCFFFRLFFQRDHPHPCGEKLPHKGIIAGVLGSPPPMWGKVGKFTEL